MIKIEELIKKAKKIHSDKYDYSKVEYVKYDEKVCIICPIHGEFWQTLSNHCRLGQGCPKCGKESMKNKRRMTKEQFIEKARKIHGDKYDYSKVNYINYSTKVCIICPIHGEFWQVPRIHISNKAGCPKCKTETLKNTFKHSKEQFIEKARKIHGDKYDYSKVNYINNKEKVCIICPTHGEFWMIPTNHYRLGQGCPKCAGQGLSQNDIIERFRSTHKDTYDYSKIDYCGWDTKVCIICPTHGEFWQKPYKHYIGQGCPMCKQSKLENEIRTLLEENNIEYKIHYRPKWMEGLELDFYLPKYNVGIECQGEQHFRPVNFGWNDEKIAKEKFIGQIERDTKKLKLSEIHLNGLYYFSDFKSSMFLTEKIYKNKEKLLKEIIKKSESE